MKTIKYFIFDVFFFLSALIVLIISFIISLFILDFVFYRRNRNFLIEERKRIKEEREIKSKISKKGGIKFLAEEFKQWRGKGALLYYILRDIREINYSDTEIFCQYFKIINYNSFETELKCLYMFLIVNNDEDYFSSEIEFVHVISRRFFNKSISQL